MKKTVLLLLSLVALFAVTTGATTHPAKSAAAHAAKPMTPPMTPDDMKWGDAPAVFQPGAKMAVLAGDPGAKGLYAVRLSMPDGYRIAAHWHPTDEHVTVISGMFHIGMGDTFDDTKGIALPAGSYGVAPAHMNHYAWAEGATVVQVDGVGPFKLTYVNPADMPVAAK